MERNGTDWLLRDEMMPTWKCYSLYADFLETLYIKIRLSASDAQVIERVLSVIDGLTGKLALSQQEITSCVKALTYIKPASLSIFAHLVNICDRFWNSDLSLNIGQILKGQLSLLTIKVVDFRAAFRLVRLHHCKHYMTFYTDQQ